MAFEDLVRKQREFFHSGKTKQIAYRLDSLKGLRVSLVANQNKIYAALRSDLGKCEFESYAGEVGMALSEISEALKHVRSWAKPRAVKRRLLNFPDRNTISPQPYGITLVIGPWNYPLQLALVPVISAISAGNCVILKPSELAPATSQVVAEVLREVFREEHVAVVEGGIDESRKLLEQKVDFIFFTGNSRVGRAVMKAAAEHLTPVALELGGKSPALVDSDANIQVAARRIVWGKYFNAGQTCVAPDYLLVHSKVAGKLLEAMTRTVREFYGADPRQSSDYSRIISKAHVDRLAGLMSRGRILIGGETDREDKYVAPTVIVDVGWDDPIMQDEILGPILPVLEFEDLESAIEMIASRPSPLALYYFSEDEARYERILERLKFGGGCFNDCVVHLLNPNLPFGGVGESGIGSYHGKAGFDVFSHHRSILKRGTWLDIPLRYPPYAGKLKWIRRFLR